MMNKDTKIYVAGHLGLVGSAVMRQLETRGYTNLITRTHKELDLVNQSAVQDFFATVKPLILFLIMILSFASCDSTNLVYQAEGTFINSDNLKIGTVEVVVEVVDHQIVQLVAGILDHF